jgi:hypothetical protein
MTIAAAADVAERVRRKGLTRVVQAVLAVVVVVAVFAYAVPKFADYGSAWAVVRMLSWAQVVLLVAVTAVNVVSYWSSWSPRCPA